jgi:hypothetical protein
MVMAGRVGRIGWPTVAASGMLTVTCTGICCHPGALQLYSRLGLATGRPAAGAALDSTMPVPARMAAMAAILATGRCDSRITMLAPLIYVMSQWFVWVMSQWSVAVAS